jgi:ABC-2 type transport system ATP-binding protein
MIDEKVITRVEPDNSRSAPAIEVRDLRQKYGDFEAVKGISFEVQAGELFALLGTNGAGKTTTIELLEGFRQPSDGSVRVLGFDPFTQRGDVRPHTGLMLQEGGFFNDLTVAETVTFWRDVSVGKPNSLGDTLALVELSDKADVLVRQLSGGQKRRLDLALATLVQPKVLFLDEPTTGMDPEARRNTWTIIEDLVTSGTTVLLTTHYLEEAEHLADRLAIMHDGRIEVTGTIEQVIADRGNRVRFHVPDALPVDRLPLLSGIGPTTELRKGQLIAEYTLTADPANTQHALSYLISWASEHHLVLDRLEVRSTSLEDVFLEVANAA